VTLQFLSAARMLASTWISAGRRSRESDEKPNARSAARSDLRERRAGRSASEASNPALRVATAVTRGQLSFFDPILNRGSSFSKRMALATVARSFPVRFRDRFLGQ